MKTISNEIIRKLSLSFDHMEVSTDDNENLPVKEWVVKYRNLVKSKEDIVWLLCRDTFLSKKDLRLFAVWCAREALKLDKNADQRSIDACDIAEKYANGSASEKDLTAARVAAKAAAKNIYGIIDWASSFAAVSACKKSSEFDFAWASYNSYLITNIAASALDNAKKLPNRCHNRPIAYLFFNINKQSYS